MKSILGFLVAVCVVLAFVAAYYLAVRPGAGWLDAQWLFLAALPYNWTSLRLVGEANFSPDSPREIAAAAAFDIILAFLVGFVLQAIARLVWRALRRRA